MFEDLWRAAIAEVAEHGCERGRTTRTRSVVTLRNLEERRDFTCVDVGARWARLVTLFDGTIASALTPAPPQDQIDWPFKGDYWKDELRYASPSRRAP
jgi:hypothetical protein